MMTNRVVAGPETASELPETQVIAQGAVLAATERPEAESCERPGPVWQPNNHSEWEIRWQETDQVELVRTVLITHFGFSTVDSVEKVDRVENHSHNFKVSGTTTDGASVTVFVKKKISEKRPEALETIGRVYDYLNDKGVPTQHNIESTDGPRVVAHEGHLWQVFEFIPGHHFRGTESELRQAAEVTADTHKALADAPQELVDEIAEVRPSRLRRWSAEELEQLIVDAEHAAADGTATLRQRVLARYATYFREQIRKAVADAERMVGARRQLGKGTIHPHDFIFENGEIKAFIDVEEIEQTELVRDVATALHRQVRQFMVHHETSSPQDLARGVTIFLDAYTAKNPLTKDEIALIPVFLRDSLLRKVMSASLSPTYADKPEEGEYEVQKFAVLLEEVDLIEAAVLEYARNQSK